MDLQCWSEAGGGRARSHLSQVAVIHLGEGHPLLATVPFFLEFRDARGDLISDNSAFADRCRIVAQAAANSLPAGRCQGAEIGRWRPDRSGFQFAALAPQQTGEHPAPLRVHPPTLFSSSSFLFCPKIASLTGALLRALLENEHHVYEDWKRGGFVRRGARRRRTTRTRTGTCIFTLHGVSGFVVRSCRPGDSFPLTNPSPRC